MTDAINTITDDRYSENREKLFDSIAALISKSMGSTALKTALKESLVASLMDEDLQDATLNTLQNALIKASENEGLRRTIIHVVKLAFVQALNDEDFVRDLMKSIVGALVQASKEEELTTAILDVVTRAVSQALADENFTNELRGAVKDTLKDGDIYKAGAKGMISAAFGFAWGSELQKGTKKDQKQLT
jgi:membrane carboxypeptidase/penicillin-binding protein